MEEKREETLIEVGDYKLYRGIFNGVQITAVIKCGFFTRLVEADHQIPPEETKEFLATMLNDGRLCDSYLSKKVALADLHKLMAGVPN
jgi:hypothetical protein